MAALSALVFSLSWWLGLYLLARNPRKPVLAFSAVGLCSFAMAVALDNDSRLHELAALREASEAARQSCHSECNSSGFID